MEKHIFKFGNNSSAFILPKKWLDKNGLKPSSEVYVSESESGNLIIAPTGATKKEAEKVVTSRTSPQLLGRWVGLHYMFGTGKLRIYSSDGLGIPQIEAVEDKLRRECPGFEITSQSGKDIIMEDLTDIREIDLEKIMMRIRSLVKQEFYEMSRRETGGTQRLEELVNRFYMLGARYINITQAKDALVHLEVLGSLEEISDRLVVVSSNFRIKDARMFADIGALFDLSDKAMKGDGKAIEQVEADRDAILRRISRSGQDRMYLKLVREVVDKISGIAEYGLRVESDSPLQEQAQG
jgi:antitoxin component of MazEF toxin-antitoxin module